MRWYGSAILNNAWNTGDLATAATRWTVPDSPFIVDPTAYLDLRASYDLTDNLQFYGAVDNLLNTPPAMVPGYSGGIQSNGGPIHSITQYDLLGREIRLLQAFHHVGDVNLVRRNDLQDEKFQQAFADRIEFCVGRHVYKATLE